MGCREKIQVEKLMAQDKRWEDQFPVTTIEKTDSTRRRYKNLLPIKVGLDDEKQILKY